MVPGGAGAMTTVVRTKPAGWIYLVHTAADPNKYIGQAARPVWTRINEHRRCQEWGPDILPGRTGYTIIRRVEATGNPTLDAIALDLAEAEEIQRRHPTENTYRPDPQVFRDRYANVLAGRPATPPRTPSRVPRGSRTRPTGRTPRGTWGHRARGAGILVLAVVWAVAAVRVGIPVGEAAQAPWVPWVAAPVAFALGPALTLNKWRSAGRRTHHRRRRRR
jgi:hypothetical protein